MTNIRRMLDADERAEYDALFYEASYDADGKPRATAEVGDEMLRLLHDAEKAGRKWATWILDDALLAGLRASARKWCSTKEVIQSVIGERIVTKPAAYGIKRRGDGGVQQYLRAGWGDMTEEDLDQLIGARATQIAAEQDTITIARKLKALVRRAGKSPVSAALAELGISLDEYLSQAA